MSRPYLICDWLSSEDDPRNTALIGQLLYPLDFLCGPPCRYPCPITCYIFSIFAFVYCRLFVVFVISFLLGSKGLSVLLFFPFFSTIFVI